MNLTNSNLTITMTGNSSTDTNPALSDFFRPLNFAMTSQAPATKKAEVPAKPRTIRFADEKAEAALLLESILLFEPDEYFDDPSVVEAVMDDFHDSSTSMSSFDSWEYAHGGNCPTSGCFRSDASLSWRDIEKQVREQQAKEFQRQQLLGPLLEPDDEEGSEGDDKATQMVPFEILQVTDSQPPVSPMPASPYSGGGKKKLSTNSLLMVSPLVSPKPQLQLYASSPALTSPRRRTNKVLNSNLQMALSRSESLQCFEDAAEARRQREDQLDHERAQKAAQTAREKREKEEADRKWREAGRKGSAVQQRLASFENNNQNKPSLFETKRPTLRRNKTDSERLSKPPAPVQRSKTYKERRSSLPTLTLLWPPPEEQEQEQEQEEAQTTKVQPTKKPRRHSTDATSPSSVLELEEPQPTAATSNKPKKRNSIQAVASVFEPPSSLLDKKEDSSKPTRRPSLHRSRTDSERLKGNKKPVQRSKTYQERRSSLPTLTLLWPPSKEQEESKAPTTQHRRHSTETMPASPPSLLGELQEEEEPSSPTTTASSTPKKRNSIQSAMSLFEKNPTTPSMFGKQQDAEDTTAPKSTPSKRRSSTSSISRRRSSASSVIVQQSSPMEPEVINLFEPEKEEVQQTMDSSEVVHLFELQEDDTTLPEEESAQSSVGDKEPSMVEQEQSALRIQCVLRGWLVRRVVRTQKSAPSAQQNAQAAQEKRYKEVEAAQEASIVAANAWNQRERSAIRLQAVVRGWLVRRVVRAAEARIEELQKRLQAIRQDAIRAVQSEYGPELEALKEEHRAVQQANASYQRRVEIEEQKVVIRRDIALVKDQNEKISQGMEQLEAHNRAIAKSTKEIQHRTTVVEKRVATLQKTNDRLRPQLEQLQERVRNVEQEVRSTTVQTQTERAVGRICRTTILKVRNAAKAVAKDSDCSFLKKVELRAKILDRIHNKQVAMETASQQEHMQALGACPLLLSR